MVDDVELAAVLADFAHTMLGDFRHQTILDRLVERVVDVPPVSGAGVTAESGQAAAETAVELMSGLEHSIAEISNVNQLIAKIAAQTNLLALNATIEASRTGVAGRGFAVVADEVEQMSNETAVSVQRVSNIVTASVEEQFVTFTEVADALASVSGASKAIFVSLDRLGSVVASAVT